MADRTGLRSGWRWLADCVLKGSYFQHQVLAQEVWNDWGVLAVELEDHIRKLAVEGHSKSAAAEQLGIPLTRLQLMLDVLPDVEWPKTRTPLTAETAELIEKLCKRGHSRAETAKILGIPENRFRRLIERLPDLNWPTRSLTRIECDRARAESKAFGYVEQNRQRALEARRESAKRTVRGVSGSIPELLAHFKIDVSPSTIRRRLAEGKTIEEALFAKTAPRRPKIRDWYVGSVLKSGPYYQVPRSA